MRLHEFSAYQARKLIAVKEISPLELLEACISQIEEVNESVNAITATCFARARQEAAEAERKVLANDRLGVLHGLPMGVKDVQDTEGVLTTYGQPALRENIPICDAPVVARMREAGAIVLGKTNVPEGGPGANTRNPVWGATGNPFNPLLSAGGSSGGSAVALACDMVPLATGGDTGGSLRIPAAMNGVVGLRPSPGFVANQSRLLGWSPLSVGGPMGRTVADVRLSLAGQMTVQDNDPLSLLVNPFETSAQTHVELSDLRIGYTEDFGVCPVDQVIRATFREKIERISQFTGHCEQVDFDFQNADRCFDIMRALLFMAKNGDRFHSDPHLLPPLVRTNLEIAEKMTLEDAAWAHREQTRMYSEFNRLYDDFDIIISPVTPISPLPWKTLYPESIDGVAARNYYHWLGLTYVTTLTTNPSISIPCGTDPFGMPFGLQLTGKYRRDLLLLDIAEAFESYFNEDLELARAKPDFSKLRKPTTELREIVTSPPPPHLTHDH